MIEFYGEYSLMAAMIFAAAAVLFTSLSMSYNSHGLMATSRLSIAGVAGSLTLACGSLLAAFINDDFRFKYVADYSEKALPTSYKIAALWAGQSGSLLLWAWMLGVLSLIAVAAHRKSSLKDQAGLIYTLAFACGFFAIMLVYIQESNPFRLLEVAQSNGRGLNPMLQDPAMIAHPPVLFLGYAGFTIPFGVMMGAFYANRTDHDWLASVRRWSVFSWLFLTVGIILGSWWAYVELGWGGYWAWDPVENASLLPWLTGTAVLHSVIGQQQKQMFRLWNVLLIAGSFFLCLFATYLTRSGIMSSVSVHSFPASSLGTLFLVFMGVTILVTAIVVALRWNIVSQSQPLEALVTREGAFLGGNVLLVIIMLTTAVGTMVPVVTSWFMENEVNVKQPFYNSVVVPMGIILVGMMVFGPLLGSTADSGKKLAKAIYVPSVLAILAMVAVGIWLAVSGHFDTQKLAWSLVCTAICVIGFANVLIDFVGKLRGRVKETGENILAAGVRLIDANHRRYGGQLAHTGVMLVVIGILGSSLFNVEQRVELEKGQSVTVAGFNVQFDSYEIVKKVNYVANQATLKVTDESGRESVLQPEIRRYNGWREQPNTEVAIASTWKSDVYLTLADWSDSGDVVAVEVIVNPLVSWIWIGGVVMTLAGIFCLMPKVLPTPSTPEEAGRQPTSQQDTEELMEMMK